MDWKFEVVVELNRNNFVTNLDISLFGGGLSVPITLDFQPNASKTGVIEGGIEFECRHSPTLQVTSPDACYCEMWNLKQIPVREVSKISADLLKRDVPAAVKGVAGLSYNIVQPSVRISLEQPRVTSTNGGKCYNVFIDVKAEFTPGEISAGTKVTIPGIPIEVPIDTKATVGQSATARLQAEYRVCCCEWDNSLNVYDKQNDGPLADAGDYVVTAAKPENCKCDRHIENLSCTVTGDKSLLSMHIKAIERDCNFEDRSLAKGGRAVKVKGATERIVMHPP